MRTIKFCSVVFGLYPSTDTKNVQAGCHEQEKIRNESLMWHFVFRMRDTQTPPLSVITLLDVRRSSSDRQQGQILL